MVVAPLKILDLGEVGLQEEEEVFRLELTSQVLEVEEEIISVSEDLVEVTLGESSIALEEVVETLIEVEALIEVDLLEYKVLVEGAGAVDKVLGRAKAFVVTEGVILVAEGGVSTVVNLVGASTLVEEEILAIIPWARTLDHLEWEEVRSIHPQLC